MNALALCKAFVRGEESPAELRAYCAAHSADLAAAFGVAPERFDGAVAETPDDKLGARLLATIADHARKGRAAKRTARRDAAQSATERLSLTWQDGRARVDGPLLACLLPGEGLLVFQGEGWNVAIRCSKLRDLLALRKADLEIHVTPELLQARWNGGRGGLNLRDQRPIGDTDREWAEHLDHVGAVIVAFPDDDAAHAYVAAAAAPAPASPPELPPVSPKKDPPPMAKKSLDRMISDFQNACLQKMRDVEQVASEAIASAERDRDAALASVEALRAAHGAELGAVRAELEQVRLLAAMPRSNVVPLREPALAPDSELSALRGRVAALEEALEEARTETRQVREELSQAVDDRKEAVLDREAFESEAKELRIQIDQLQAEIPEPMALAALVHDYLRAERLLPEGLDVPLRVSPHAYLTGLVATMADELPSH